MMATSTLKVTPVGDREIRITRIFDAPRASVWKAMTTPALLRKWLFGPPGWTMTVCEDDFRVGGHFRWEWVGPGGLGMVITGVNNEIVPPGPNGSGGRSARTETFETGCGPGAMQQSSTMQLTEHPTVGGTQTLLTLTVLYASKEARDGMLASGMEHGMGAGYDRLDQMLAQGQV